MRFQHRSAADAWHQKVPEAAGQCTTTSSGDGALTLHRALDKQLEELAAASETKKVAMLDDVLAALDKVADHSEMAQRSR